MPELRFVQKASFCSVFLPWTISSCSTFAPGKQLVLPPIQHTETHLRNAEGSEERVRKSMCLWDKPLMNVFSISEQVLTQYKLFLPAFLNSKERSKLVPMSSCKNPVETWQLYLRFRSFSRHCTNLVKQKQKNFAQAYTTELLLCPGRQTCRLWLLGGLLTWLSQAQRDKGFPVPRSHVDVTVQLDHSAGHQAFNTTLRNELWVRRHCRIGSKTQNSIFGEGILSRPRWCTAKSFSKRR